MLSSRPISINADGPFQYGAFKTPGRNAHKSRNALQENVIHHGAKTMLNVKSNKASFQTPLKVDSLKPQKLFKDGTQPTKATSTASRPLQDKTPFPNRQRNLADASTPAPSIGKLVKLAALDAHLTIPDITITPGALLRPGSGRKSTRPRRSPALNFKTPITKGRHWDVSDIDIVVPVEEAEKTEEELEDHDELEYMPPTAIDLPYEPAFDMPDYKVAGANLRKQMYSYYYDDTADLYYAADRENMGKGVLEASGFAASPSKWEKLELPELEDDSPFAIPSTTSKPATKNSFASSRAGTSSKIQPPSASKALNCTLPTAASRLASLRAVSKAPSTRAAPATRPPAAAAGRSLSRIPASAPRNAAPPPTHSRTTSATTISRPATSAATRAPSSRAVASSIARPATSIASRSTNNSNTTVRARSTATITASSTRNSAHAESSPDELIFAFEGASQDENEFRFDV